MNTIIRYIVKLLQDLSNLWFRKKSIPSNLLNIFVRSNTGSLLSLHLDPKCNVKNIKEIIAPKIDANPNDVKIIFAGKELDNSTVIEECNLGQNSTIHAIKVSKSSTVSTNNLTHIKEREKDEDVASEEQIKLVVTNKKYCEKKDYFYVYCDEPCGDCKRGKLRVRCSSCKSGAIIVDRDPRSWNDVLRKKQITGHCEQNGCVDGSLSWAEFYFKCGQHESQNEADYALPLNLVATNVQLIPCLACTDVKEVVLVFPCEERHTTCLDCFRMYANSKLRERQFTLFDDIGYSLPCPVGCDNSVIKETWHFKLLPKDQYKLYQKFGAEDFVLKQPGGVLCPQPGCGAGIIADESCSRITCVNGCDFVFCRHCLQGYHVGECAENNGENYDDMRSTANHVNPLNASQARWNVESRNKIRISTKPCPKCRTATERDGGCMHMVCTRCNFDWCWVCQTEWTRDCMGSHWFG